jgi:hypothetical protein
VESAKSVTNLAIIKTSHLPSERNHFGPNGTIGLGKEIAASYLEKIAAK